MSRTEELKRLRRVSDLLLEENIAAGPGDGMAFRYAASVAEKQRRAAWPVKVALGVSVVSAIAAVASAVAAAYSAAAAAASKASPGPAPSAPQHEEQRGK